MYFNGVFAARDVCRSSLINNIINIVSILAKLVRNRIRTTATLVCPLGYMSQALRNTCVHGKYSDPDLALLY
eukprot:SAG31_NODE_1418_length_8439_cov_20.075540_8_plen_72_part_00